ncbi:hypothetical protein ABIA85_004506 [Bradyrhizobium sp. LA6.10]
MIEGRPIEPRTEINLHLLGQVAGERSEVGHTAGIFGRDDEPEMVAVVLTPLGKGRAIRTVAGSIEHTGGLTTSGDAVALQVRKMGRQWR